jgi:Trk K+ transport system NAD-binding subunit
VGWRLTPRRDDGGAGKRLFSVGDYVTELRVPEGSPRAGSTLHNLLTDSDEGDDLAVLALIRDGARKIIPSTFTVLREGDLLLIEANTESLQAFLDNTDLELATGALLAPQGEPDDERKGALSRDSRLEREPGADKAEPEAPISLDEGDLQLMEVVVSPGSTLLGLSANRMRLRERHQLNVVAVARTGQRIQRRLGDIRFQAGDILLVQGTQDGLTETLITLGCLPLAERGLRLGSSRKVALAAAVFGASIAAVVSGLLSAPVALVSGAVAMVLVGLLSAEDAYKSIDWSIIVLLAAMIPVGQALETSGGARLLANQMLILGGDFSLAAVLAMLLVVTLLLSNMINNAAAAIVVAPVALSLATSLNVPTDAVLMAVAIGASSAFMTPIGHQSNALVMEPGGYQFGDYWRLGLPLSIIVTVVAVPMIMLVWA